MRCRPSLVRGRAAQVNPGGFTTPARRPSVPHRTAGCGKSSLRPLMAGSSPSLPDGSNPSAAIVQSASDVQCSRLLKTTFATDFRDTFCRAFDRVANVSIFTTLVTAIPRYICNASGGAPAGCSVLGCAPGQSPTPIRRSSHPSGARPRSGHKKARLCRALDHGFLFMSLLQEGPPKRPESFTRRSWQTCEKPACPRPTRQKPRPTALPHPAAQNRTQHPPHWLRCNDRCQRQLPSGQPPGQAGSAGRQPQRYRRLETPRFSRSRDPCTHVTRERPRPLQHRCRGSRDFPSKCDIQTAK